MIHDGYSGAVPEQAWFKSSYSSNEGGECVEIAHVPSFVCIRDSKSPGGPRLNVAPGVWGAFVRQAVEMAVDA